MASKNTLILTISFHHFDDGISIMRLTYQNVFACLMTKVSQYVLLFLGLHFCYGTTSSAMGVSAVSQQAFIKSAPSAETQILTDKIITTIEQQQWLLLYHYIYLYEARPDQDAIFLYYARGVLYKANYQYNDAIDEFRKAIAIDPDFIEIRLILAICLYEHEEYEAARDQFYKINAASNLSEKNRQLVQAYLSDIVVKNNWDYNIDIDFMKNNVNDDSYERLSQIEEVKSNGKQRTKRNALGLGYNLGISRNFAVIKSQYIVPAIGLRGWDYSDELNQYHEVTLHSSLGYQYITPTVWFKITPSIDSISVNNEKFAQNKGVTLTLEQWVNTNWQIVSSYSNTIKDHEKQQYNFLNGRMQEVGFTFYHLYSPTFKLWTGISYGYDRLQLASESSNKQGIEFGVEHEFSWGTSVQLQLKYKQRQFIGVHTVYSNQRRVDDDYMMSLSVWNRDVFLWGITPRINYIYRRIDSSIPDLYNRKIRQLFFSLEKTF